MITADPRSPARSWRAILVAPALLALAGCASTASPSPATPAPAASPTPVTASPSTAATPSPVPSAIPSAPAPSGSLAAAGPIPAAPAGPWSTIAWIDGGSTFPLVESPGSEAFFLNVFGWSGGYVAFASDAGTSGSTLDATLETATSSDGIHWSAAKPLGLAGFANQVEVAGVAESPGGLVAIGEYPPGTCGGPTPYPGFWRSSDGSAWTRVQQPDAMASAGITSLNGGPSGFIATGSKDGAPVVWLSPDGSAWNPAKLPKVSGGTLVVDGGFSLRGGFVLAGAILGPATCGGNAELRPAVWWSPDGVTWTAEALPGALVGTDITLGVDPIAGNGLLAIEYGDPSSRIWATADGRSWTRTRLDSASLCCTVLSDGRHTIAPAEDPNNVGPWTIHELGGDLSVTTLTQTGATPVDSETGPQWSWAAGPTGLLAVAGDGSNIRLGVPRG